MDRVSPLISIVIPIYNVENYLDTCIGSVCAQSYDHLEIILVDDGSSDSSLSVCNRYKETDRRVVLIHKENGGLVSARKAGVAAATGEYITFVDGDDWIDEDALGQVAAWLMKPNQVDIIAYGCVEEYPVRKEIRTNKIEQGIYTGRSLEILQQNLLMGDTFFEWNMLPHLCDKVIKKKLLAQCIQKVPDSISFGEDAVCSFLCMKSARSICVRNIFPYHYRQREGSIVRGRKELGCDNFQNIYRTLTCAAGDDPKSGLQIKLYLFFILCLKAYKKIGGPMPLFPFERVRPGSRVFVYGAGGFGKVVAGYAAGSKDLELAGWTDQNADYYMRQGYKVKPYNRMLEEKYDYLVIAILNEEMAGQIKDVLIGQGIPEEKIDYVRREVLEKQELPGWL